MITDEGKDLLGQMNLLQLLILFATPDTLKSFLALLHSNHIPITSDLFIIKRDKEFILDQPNNSMVIAISQIEKAQQLVDQLQPHDA